MRIITKGVIPSTRPHRATCSHCKTVFEFVEMEAKRIPDQRDGDYFHINCPVCQHAVSKDVKR